MISGIYSIVNAVSGKRYIGSSSDIERRWTQHQYYLGRGRHSNVHLQNSWSKYGSEAFGLEILQQDVPEGDLVNLEQKILDTYQDEGKWSELYNISSYARMPSEEVKAKLSRAHSGTTGYWYGVRGEDNPLYGRTLSEEHKRKISETKLNNPHYLRGKAMPESHRKALRGKVFTPEWRTRQSKCMSGKGNPMYGKTGEDAPLYGVTGPDHPAYGQGMSEGERQKKSEMMTGSGNVKAKITLDQALWVIALRHKANLSYREIADHLPISVASVGKISRRTGWLNAWKVFDGWEVRT